MRSSATSRLIDVAALLSKHVASEKKKNEIADELFLPVEQIKGINQIRQREAVTSIAIVTPAERIYRYRRLDKVILTGGHSSL